MRRILPATVLGAVLALAAMPAAAGRQPIATQQAPGAAQGVQDHGDGLVVPANFDDASFDDLAIGAPGEDIGAVADAGTVVAVYPGGQRPPETFRQGAGGVAGAAERGDRFGTALAIGLFNDDTFDDLAVGVPGEDVGGAVDAGAVSILYGSASGLTGGPLLTESPPRAGARFGAALAASDFNFDRAHDLAVGAPDAAVAGAARAGRVTVLLGSSVPGGPTGLGSGGVLVFRQGAGGLPGAAEPGDRFGAALAAGDMTPGGSFSDDLAVGAPGEDVGAAVDAGAVNLIAGTEAGLAPGALYLQGRPERGDRFGSALTLNNFLGSGDDLAVGAPGETVAGIAGAGAVSLFDGTATAPGREWLLHEGLANSGPVEAGDAFGAALGWYTVHPGGFLMTLVVGAPGRNRFGTDAGAVFPCYSYPGQGLLCDQHRLQDEGAGAEAGDAYGAAVSGGSYFTADRNFYDADGLEDVVVGAPGETVGSARGAGAATIIYGDQYFEIQTLLYQGHGGVGGTPEPGDAFGAAVA
jgi:FG-GAP repeat